MSIRITQLLTVAAALAITGIAGATTRSAAPSVVVKYDDLSLKSRGGIATLHARIHNAAEDVCGSYKTRVRGLRDEFDTCVHDTINQAVASVHNQNLTNYHLYGRKPAASGYLASNQKQASY